MFAFSVAWGRSATRKRKPIRLHKIHDDKHGDFCQRQSVCHQYKQRNKLVLGLPWMGGLMAVICSVMSFSLLNSSDLSSSNHLLHEVLKLLNMEGRMAVRDSHSSTGHPLL